MNREIKFRAWDLLELKMIGCETIFSIVGNVYENPTPSI